MYEVFLERTARKDLEALPARVFRQVIACVRGLAHNPRPPGARKIVGSDNAWRVRVGDYRVVYEVDDAAFRVIVYRVRHRKEAYRGL
ncbi:MAG: type II toxin-antitoxin system RelE/ParE family toxin [Bacillota bacterium]